MTMQPFPNGSDPDTGLPPLAALLGAPASLSLPSASPYPALAGPTPQVDLPAMAAPQEAQQHQGGGFFSHGLGGGLRDFLGILGDALLVQSGHQPMYGPMKRQRKIGSALQNYLGNMDPGLAEIFAADPQTGLALYKMAHQQEAPPTNVREYQYAKSQGYAGSYADWVKMTHPAFLSPVTLGPNDTVEGGGAAGGEVTATGPNGEKIRFNPQTNAWEPLGGQTAQPSGNFPVSNIMDALTAQESHGDGTAVGPATKYGRAYGSTQLQPGTAKEMASKVGVPFRPDLLRSNDPAALRYQRTLAEAYFNEGLQKHGNVRDALRYYHGGPNTALWGPKTNAYADQVLARLGGR